MTDERVVERFRKPTIWFHWIHTAAFLALIITGAIIFLSGIGGAAAGGITRLIHRIAVVIFVVAPAVYFVSNPRLSLHFIKETLTWGKSDLDWLKAAPLYYFGGAEDKMPPQPHINTGQKMWQFIILGTTALFLITGFIMWFLKGIVPSAVVEWCIIVHDIAFLTALAMLLVHIYLGVLHPRMTESFSSMVDGKISVHYAKSHYGKWYDETSKKSEN